MHGTEGSLIGRNVHDAAGRSAPSRCATPTARAELPLDTSNLYETRAAKPSMPPSPAKGRPAATGEDGIWSLATGLAVVEAARSGRHVRDRTSDFGMSDEQA